MNKNKTTTYGDLKCRKQEMRNEGILIDMEGYLQNMNAIKDAEDVLLWGISDEEKNGELPIVPKVYKRVKYVVIAISIAVILVIVLFVGSGCAHTINGVGQDLVVWSSPYIEHQEKQNE